MRDDVVGYDAPRPGAVPPVAPWLEAVPPGAARASEPAGTTELPLRSWQEREARHAARADALTAGHRARRGTGAGHPIEDFLFEYYNHSPAKLRRWHPGPGVRLADAAELPRALWRGYRREPDGAVVLDHQAVLAQRGQAVDFIRRLLTATLSRPAFAGCFGMHEWAMVYRLAPEALRHAALPLRLSPAETDAVLEANSLRCSHFDAFRFFTLEAVGRNALQPARDRQVDLEQPGCLHAGMDVYKWAHKLEPLTPGELTLDAFELALQIRVLDMQASPYDLAELGYPPVPVETAAGKAEYAARQRELAVRSNDLRRRLLTVLDAICRPDS